MSLSSEPLRRDLVAGIMLLAAVPLLAAGLLMPAISVTRLVMFGETYSIVEAVFAFWSGGRYLLFSVVFFFSLVFPATKILIALWSWGLAGRNDRAARRLLALFAKVSRWSMLDVFIVALTVLVLEGSLLSSADVHLGLVLFAASVVLSTIAIHRLARSAGGRP